MQPLSLVNYGGYEDFEEDGIKITAEEMIQDMLLSPYILKFSDLKGNQIQMDALNFYINEDHSGSITVDIQGEDNKFTVTYLSTDEDDDLWGFYMISGELSGNVIKDMYYAGVNIDRQHNPESYIIFKDTDGVSDAFDWNSIDWSDLGDDDDDWYARRRTPSISNASGNPAISKQLKALRMSLKRNK